MRDGMVCTAAPAKARGHESKKRARLSRVRPVPIGQAGRTCPQAYEKGDAPDGG